MFDDDSGDDALSVVQTLVALSEIDALYADQYLLRAEALLPEACTREEYAVLTRLRTDLPRAMEDLRRSTEHGDWQRVRNLAENAAEMRRRLSASEAMLQLADAVYGSGRLVHLDTTVLALSGVIVGSAHHLRHARDRTVEQLRLLLAADPEWVEFYRERLAHFERLELVVDEESGVLVDGAAVRRRILEAVDKGDFARVEKLARSIVTEGAGRPGRLRAPRPSETVVEALTAPLPPASIERAYELGLSMEVLPADEHLNRYLSCCCADRATFSDADTPADHPCTCGHACPPGVRATLRENLDLVIGHPFVNFAGGRYLPWFGTETVLVETFPEDGSGRPTGLAEMLHLPRRDAIPRTAIEEALLTHGSRACAELGLDPMEFAVACIPFDVYLRLAPKYGWGQQPLWTHFDGYQVTREVQLLALVGGHSQYGGPDDLSSLGRDYDSHILRARFAIVRRQRFLVRATQEQRDSAPSQLPKERR